MVVLGISFIWSLFRSLKLLWKYGKSRHSKGSRHFQPLPLICVSLRIYDRLLRDLFGVSLWPDLSSLSLWISGVNIVKIFETPKSKSIENKEVESTRTMTSSRSCNMGRICFRHTGGAGLAVYMDTFEVLSTGWLYCIVSFSGILWKPLWRLHRLSVYMEWDRSSVLSWIGIICPAYYMFPIHSFWQCSVDDSCVLDTVQTLKPCFPVWFRPENHVSSMFYMLKPCF